MEAALQCQNRAMKVNGRTFIKTQYWCVSSKTSIRLKFTSTFIDILVHVRLKVSANVLILLKHFF